MHVKLNIDDARAIAPSDVNRASVHALQAMLANFAATRQSHRGL